MKRQPGRYRGVIKRPARRRSDVPNGLPELEIHDCAPADPVCDVCNRIFSVIFASGQDPSRQNRARVWKDPTTSASVTFFLDDDPKHRVTHEHQPSFAVLLKSAQGCILCRLIFNGFASRGFMREIMADYTSSHATQISFGDHSEEGKSERVLEFTIPNPVHFSVTFPTLVIYTEKGNFI